MKGFIFSEKGIGRKSSSDTQVSVGQSTSNGNLGGALLDPLQKKTLESISGKFLLLLTIILMCIGVLMVYSSGAGWGARKFQDSEYFLWRQLIYVILGIGVIFFVGGIDYKLLKKYSKIIWMVSIALLALLLILKAGGVITGAARWLGYGRFRFQASDLAKYALIIHLAMLLSEKQSFIKDLEKSFQPMMIVIGITVVLVALAPNFSTAAVLAAIGMMILFAGGVSVKHLTITGLCALPPAALFVLFGGYRKDRIDSFIGEASYQNEQALIGLGNGGLFGLGIGASKQRELFLPASYNDFIFAVVGEEYGFLGAVALLLLFVGIVWCGFTIARHALDDFGKYLAFGITVALGMYAFVNAAVACHLLPNTGLPMPFISYGGSAALFNALGVGLLISISREKKRRLNALPSPNVMNTEIGHLDPRIQKFSGEGA
ncbi:MAG: putative peptidoglycan glycosyltransferase FtsW [Chloroherpetonaceae bacterium]|nr:putative peptidoglycan glycosyltransferase FtsW [Chloroherpetonaceae bacterium]